MATVYGKMKKLPVHRLRNQDLRFLKLTTTSHSFFLIVK